MTGLFLNIIGACTESHLIVSENSFIIILSYMGNWIPRVSNTLPILQDLDWFCSSSGALQEIEDTRSPACLRRLVRTLILVMIQITGTTQNQDGNPSCCGGISRSGRDVITRGRTSIRNRLEAERAYLITEGTFMGNRGCRFKPLQDKSVSSPRLLDNCFSLWACCVKLDCPMAEVRLSVNLLLTAKREHLLWPVHSTNKHNLCCLSSHKVTLDGSNWSGSRRRRSFWPRRHSGNQTEWSRWGHLIVAASLSTLLPQRVSQCSDNSWDGIQTWKWSHMCPHFPALLLLFHAFLYTDLPLSGWSSLCLKLLCLH